MARGRAADYDLQREAIRAQAAQLFASGGYPATSMNEVAQACGVSKATLYHYYRDKYQLLVEIAEGHVTRLQALTREVSALALGPEASLRELIRRFVLEYSSAQHAHRVLTEDVRFLAVDDRRRVLAIEREIVGVLAAQVGAIRPDVVRSKLAKPLTMLLFGMINWMFTWMKPEGERDYDQMAPIVADLFLGGLPAVKAKRPAAARTA